MLPEIDETALTEMSKQVNKKETEDHTKKERKTYLSNTSLFVYTNI